MESTTDYFEIIAAGDTASIENTQSAPLSISLAGEDGSHLELDLLPGQVLGVTAGSIDLRVILHHGNPKGLLIIYPGSAS